MAKRKQISPEEKVKAVKEYLDGKGTVASVAKKYGVTYKPFQRWIRNYQSMGEAAFSREGNRRSYSLELRQKVTAEYLAGGITIEALAKKHKILSEGTVQYWIMKYNRSKEPVCSGTGGRSSMAKGRKTTFEERVEIVRFCIAHDYNYKETSEKYQISYQQARNYTAKYEKSGMDGLEDRRGRRKPESEMNEVEKLKAEMRLLRAEKERAEMEVSFLKKLAEIERRRG